MFKKITKFALSSELIVITYLCQGSKKIWTATHGSDPKQKPDFRVTDPSPKERVGKQVSHMTQILIYFVGLAAGKKRRLTLRLY